MLVEDSNNDALNYTDCKWPARSMMDRALSDEWYRLDDGA
jgi:hypothetical protein